MGFGFETPLWLLGALLIGPLVWLYLRVRPRPPAHVSSLRIWRHVPSPTAPPRRRPKLPPLFWLQALLILATSIALASPYRREPRPPGPPRDAILVLDVSASMQSRLGSGRRFDAALSKARQRAETLSGEGRRLSILRAGPQPEVLGSGLDATAAQSALDELSPLDTASNLTAAIELAATLAGDEGSVDVFTDADGPTIVMSSDARAIAEVHTFGESGENVAVANVSVQTDPFGTEPSARLLITVRSYAEEPREVQLEIVPLDEPAAASAPDEIEATNAAESQPDGNEGDTEVGRPTLLHDLVLPARSQETISIDGIRWKGAFEVRLTTGDDLPLDDVVYGYVPGARSIDTLLVSDDRALASQLRWLAERAGSFSVRVAPPTSYDPQDVGEITIFDRFVPDLPPPSNVAYLAPERGNADVTVLQQKADVKVAERRVHPLLRGVTTAGSLLTGTPVGLAPGALRPVLMGRSEGREVGLVQAGEVGGRQIVATGFRIDPKALRRADDLPTLIFTLNLLTMLSPRPFDAPLVRNTGDRLRAGSRLAAPIEEIDGPGGTRILGAGTDITLDQAGIYEAKSRDGSRPLYVSFIDASESDLRRSGSAPEQDTTATPPAPRSEPAESDASFEQIPYLRTVLALVALLLVAEWLIVAALRPGQGRTA